MINLCTLRCRSESRHRQHHSWRSKAWAAHCSRPHCCRCRSWSHTREWCENLSLDCKQPKIYSINFYIPNRRPDFPESLSFLEIPDILTNFGSEALFNLIRKYSKTWMIEKRFLSLATLLLSDEWYPYRCSMFLLQSCRLQFRRDFHFLALLRKTTFF